MIAVATLCLVLAAAPGVAAWSWRRGVDQQSAASERIHFMLGLAAGGSLLFTLVMLLTAAPLSWLDPCRT
jgi:hypothetical protein